jgi:hypothetical protein
LRGSVIPVQTGIQRGKVEKRILRCAQNDRVIQGSITLIHHIFSEIAASPDLQRCKGLIGMARNDTILPSNL